MKRLLVITTSFPDKMDGSEAAGAFVADFVREAAKHVQVHVVAPGSGNNVSREGALSVHRFHAPRLPLSLLKPYNPLDWRGILDTLGAGQAAVDTLVREYAFDHLLALWALPSGYWAKKTGVPYSTWALGSDIWTLGKVPLVRGILGNVLRDGRFRFADGIALSRDVERICGKPCLFLPSSRVLCTNPGPSVQGKPPYKLVFLGRFHPNKGIDLLLDALDRLGKMERSAIARIRIAGGGPLQSEVEARVRCLQAKGLPVALEGYKNQEEARELLAWGDIVLIPSRIESIPVIFSDAMQMGKPVIAMPVGDLPALITDHKVGLVAPQVDAGSFAKMLAPASLDAVARLASHTGAAAEKFSVTGATRHFLAAAGMIASGTH